MPRLDDMSLFVDVVKAHSFRRAAEAAGISGSTLSRRIAALEQAIGLRLIHRTTRRFELTEAGALYYERCRRIIEEATLAHEQLSDMLEKPAGLLRLSLPVDFATVYLSPLLANFAQRYPDIRFEMDLTPRRVDLITEPFDLAIRMGEQPASGLIARKLADIPRHLYASTSYLARAGTPTDPAELEQHECLRMNTPQEGHAWTLQHAGRSVKVPLDSRFSVNSMGMLLKLAQHDQGIAILSEAMVRNDLATGHLQRVLPDWQAPPIPVFVLTETRLLPAKTQRFIAYLRDALAVSVG